jgi:hypothetical protein
MGMGASCTFDDDATEGLSDREENSAIRVQN